MFFMKTTNTNLIGMDSPFSLFGKDKPDASCPNVIGRNSKTTPSHEIKSSVSEMECGLSGPNKCSIHIKFMTIKLKKIKIINTCQIFTEAT